MAIKDYGLFKTSTIKGEKGTDWNIELYKKQYVTLTENGQFTTNLNHWDFDVNFSWISNGGIGGLQISGGGDINQDLGNDLVGTFFVRVVVSNYSSGSVAIHLGGQVHPTGIASNGVHEFQITAGIVGNLIKLDCTIGCDMVIDQISVSQYQGYNYSEDITLQGEGFEITWNGQGGTRDRVFLGSECKLNVFVQSDSDETWLSQVMTNGFKHHFIRIYRVQNTSQLWWYGWLQPSFDKFENLPYPYAFQLIATDSYGYYTKRKPDEFANQTEKITQHKIKDILFEFNTHMDLANTDSDKVRPVPTIASFISNSIDWWQPADYSATADPFDTYYVAKGCVAAETEFDEDGEIDFQNKPFEYKESDVFNAVLKTFNTVGFLAEGSYHFIQPNTYASNTNGVIKLNSYNASQTPTQYNKNTLITIDQNNHAILGGSILTFEPSLESVRATFLTGVNTFEIPQGQDLTTSTPYGVISVIPEGLLRLNFYAKHKQVVNESEFSFTSPSGESISSNFIRNNSFQSQSELKIYITNDGGTTKHYLKEDTSFSNKLVWDTSGSVQYINIYRGYDALSYQSPINSTTGMAVGPVNSNIDFTPDFPSPGYSYYNSVTNRFHQTMNIRFDALIDPPTITGQIFIELDGIMKYWEARATYSAPSWTQFFNSLSPASPTFVSNTLEAQSITLENAEENANNDVTDGLEYIAEQTEVSAFESLDLGSMDIGQTNLEGGLYSVNYSASGQIVPVTAGFQRNNPSPADPKNITQLLVNEFLALQTEPLEILQADIQSNEISPLKYIKYSINNDSNFKYYLFLGGTFKAQSEIMSGEWYRVNSKTDFITEPEPGPTNPSVNFAVPTEEGVLQSFQNNYINTLANNSIGKTNAALVSQTAYTQVTLSANVKGKYYSGQKISIAFPDGSNQLELTCSATKTGVAFVDVSSFTPTVDYPSGSIVSMRTADLTNVITGGGGTPGGSNTQVQFNDGGAFGGDGGLTYNKTTDTLTTTNLVISDIDLTSVAGQSLTITAGIYDNPVKIIGGDSKVFTAYSDNSTAGTNTIGVGAIADNTYFRNDEGSFQFYVANGATVAAELDQSGNLSLIGNIKPALTSIKILPRDFIADDVGRPLMIDDSTGDRWLKSHSTAKMYASVNIPPGFKATQLIIYGSGTSAVTVYEATIDSDTVTSKGTGNIGSVVNFTDVNYTDSNYLLIELAQTSTEKVYGGKVTIT